MSINYNNDMAQKIQDNVDRSTNIMTGEEYRAIITAIANTASKMVVKTLGPFGATTIIDDGNGMTYPSKDGWSCLNRLHFNDPLYNTIFMMLKQISMNSVTTVGDGTTTAMVTASKFLLLFNSIMDEYKAVMGNQFTQYDFLSDMKAAADFITHELTRSNNVTKIDVDTIEDIGKVAKIATNGNQSFADIITAIYKETGNPDIRVELDHTASETTYDIMKGYSFRSKVLNSYAYENADGKTINVTEPTFVYIFDKTVTFSIHYQIIQNIILHANANQKMAIIIAPHFDDTMSIQIKNSVDSAVRQGMWPSAMLVQVPLATESDAFTYKDLSLLTRATLITHNHVDLFNTMYHNSKVEDEKDLIDSDILKAEAFNNYHSPNDVINAVGGITNGLLFERGKGYMSKYENIANMAEFSKLLHECQEAYDIAKKKNAAAISGNLDPAFMRLHERLIKLKGNTGIIRVGGVSDVQRRCDKDAIDDAVLACRSAYDYGYVRGMNAEILTAIDYIINHVPVTDGVLVIIKGYFEAVKQTTAELLISKFGLPNDTTIAELDKYTESYTFIDSNKSVVSEPAQLTFSELIEFMIDEDTPYCVNIKERTIRASEPDVINSVQTDIEIIKAISSILTMVMTSSQYLSVNMSGNKVAMNEYEIEKRIKDESKIVKSRADITAQAYVDAFNAIDPSMLGRVINMIK